jgi:hypothetical protein
MTIQSKKRERELTTSHRNVKRTNELKKKQKNETKHSHDGREPAKNDSPSLSDTLIEDVYQSEIKKSWLDRMKEVESELSQNLQQVTTDFRVGREA